MNRIRIRLPKTACYQHLDLLHDALINGFTATGVEAEEIIGSSASPWNFAALGRRYKDASSVHTLVVSTLDPRLAQKLRQMDPVHIRHARAQTAEMIDFSSAEVIQEQDPIPPGEGVMGLLMLSPLAISIRENNRKRWLKDLSSIDLATVINRRLSRLAGREVRLQAQPDRLYLRANPEHSVLVPLKKMANGKRSFVIGMRAPLVLAGSEVDLRLAWYAGIGEKTRSGFGCLGLLEQGVGR
jgi:CRISPR-associated endoribonuclease Cas6